MTRSLNQILFVASICNCFIKIIKLLKGINQSNRACDLGQLLLLRQSDTMEEQDPKIYLVLQISHTMITMICSDKGKVQNKKIEKKTNKC